MDNQTINLLAMPVVSAMYGRGKASVYGDIQAGTFPRGVALTARSVRWPSNEVEAVVNLRAAGGSDADARRLVADLLRKRGGALQAARQSLEAATA